MNTPRIGTLVGTSHLHLEGAKSSLHTWVFIGEMNYGRYLVADHECVVDDKVHVCNFIYPKLQFRPDHILTRSEIYAAMDAGYILVRSINLDDRFVWAERNDESPKGPYVWHSCRFGGDLIEEPFYIRGNYEWCAVEERPKPPKRKKRHMTREEMMGFVMHHESKIVVRAYIHSEVPGEWMLPSDFTRGFHTYEWAIIDPNGTIGEPQQFPTVEDVCTIHTKSS